jgi:hypothetical protein
MAEIARDVIAPERIGQHQRRHRRQHDLDRPARHFQHHQDQHQRERDLLQTPSSAPYCNDQRRAG